jgi:hypothetical protein
LNVLTPTEVAIILSIYLSIPESIIIGDFCFRVSTNCWNLVTASFVSLEFGKSKTITRFPVKATLQFKPVANTLNTPKGFMV